MNGPKNPLRDKYAQSGFTLIEIAVVLVIIGILVGLGAGLIGPATRRIKYTQSREAVESAKQSLLGYAVRVGRVPDDAGADPLGVAGARKLDAWGRNLVYFSDPALEAGSADACSVNATTTVVQECTNADCSTFNTKSNIAFVVYSQGEDADGTGTGTASPFLVREQDSNYPNAATGPYHYDDIVAYGSLDEIRAQRQCSQPLVITSPATLSQGVEDQFYTTTLTATGGKPPYTWTSVTASGLTVATTGLVSGTINANNAAPNTGELTTCGTTVSLANVSVTDSAGTTAGPSTFTVPVIPQPLQILTQSLPAAYEGSVYSATLSASGGMTPYTWSQSVVSACPTGMTCSGNSISGTPSTGSAGTYTVTATANAAQTGACRASKSFGLTVNATSGGASSCPAMALTPSSPGSFSGTQGIAFSQSVSVSGGQGSKTNTACTSTCGGLGLSTTCSAAGVTVSGTPTSGGSCVVSPTWQDSCTTPSAQTISGSYTITIAAGCTAFSGWASSLPTGNNCTSYTGSVSVLGGISPYSWTLTAGALPGGVSFCTGASGSNCSLNAGTLLASPGAYNFTTRASDSCGTGAQTTTNPFSITVNADACYVNGIRIRNTSGSVKYYKHSASSATCRTLNNNAITGAAQAIRAAQTITFYSNNTCTTACGTTINYCSQKILDVGGSACQTAITACGTFADN